MQAFRREDTLSDGKRGNKNAWKDREEQYVDP